jgi:hypothetical protein
VTLLLVPPKMHVPALVWSVGERRFVASIESTGMFELPWKLIAWSVLILPF